MITETAHTNCFRVGRKIALAEVRDYQEAGLWTPELRTRLIRSAILQKKLMERDYPDMPGVVRYYAGRISVLKSQLTTQFSERDVEDGEIAHLMFRSLAHAQEHLREVTTYTTASGWDWERDEEDELNLMEQERMLLQPSSRSRFKPELVDIWLAVCITWFSLVQGVTVWQAILILIFSGKFAYDIEDWWIGSGEQS